MRAAMAAAEVGDDGYGDDPAVNRLQARAAGRFGFETALFFPTGTQSNLAALMAHCGRGDEYIVGQDAHTYKYEQGGAAVLGSIQPQPLEQEAHGGIAIERIAAAIKSHADCFARTRLLALENTMGGRVLPTAYLRDVTAFAHARGLHTHLDGARIFNAMVKLKLHPHTAVAGFDSVSICLSKGLGAPAGSSQRPAFMHSSTMSSAWRRITATRFTSRPDCARSVSRWSCHRPIFFTSTSRCGT
jgi:threonine aldolase